MEARERPNAIKHLVRTAAVADRITKIPHRVIAAIRGGKHRSERFKIGVDVGEDEDAHRNDCHDGGNLQG